MRLLLLGFFLVSIYQFCSPQRNKEIDTELRDYIEICHYNGKVIKYMQAGDYNDFFIYFTDGDSMHLNSYKYPIHWMRQK